MKIKKIAVLGSGVMGSGIAAHAANAGCDVALLDIVPSGAEDNDVLAKTAIEKQLKSGGFSHRNNASRVTPSNLSDGLDALKDADWIIEAVLEKLEVKQDVYRKINEVRKPGSVVSSNTSTLPLDTLTGGLGDDFAKDFMIAHFFNPPRHMRLLEVVAGKNTRKDAYKEICDFADQTLGKQVVECKDTPGFIANRIGIYWMVVALAEAFAHGIKVEQADAVMSRPVGIPKTGVFGLYDLIGIDLIPHIAKAMKDELPDSDDFVQRYELPELVQKMIDEGYTGRKGKGGFYRVRKEGDKKITEVMGLKRIHYRDIEKPDLESVNAAKGGLRAMVDHEDIGGRYAWSVLSKTFHYAASLVGEIADDITAIDEAMCAGYSWQWGPFELMDKIGVDYICDRWKENGRDIPPLMQAARGKTLYREQGGKREYLDLSGSYKPVPRTPGHLWLIDVKRGATPVYENESGKLWDLGDGIACAELTTKMNAIDTVAQTFLRQSMDKAEKDFSGLVIGGDGDHFSAGANIHGFLDNAESGNWDAIRSIIQSGQQMYLRLRDLSVPVVPAISGIALGGACELMLHAHAQALHIESYPGLVEPNVGLIPAWGGSKEMLRRHPDDILAAYIPIITANRCGSAQEAVAVFALTHAEIIFNRARLLADAKTLCQKLAANHKAPKEIAIRVPEGAQQTMLDALSAMEEKGTTSPHDLVIGRVLAHVLSGGDGSGEVSEEKMLELELEGFMELIRTKASQQRIAHTLKTGKPLKN